VQTCLKVKGFSERGDKVRALLKIIICLSLISLAQSLAPAQESAERDFEDAVDQYTVSLRSLMTSRGIYARGAEMRRRVPQTETLREISNSFMERGAPPLSEYVRSSTLSDITAALRNRFQPGTALLFYAYKNETLQIWLVSQEGLQAYSSRELSRQKLEEVIHTLRSAIGVDSLQKGRAPVPVNSPAPAQYDVRLKIDVDTAIALTTEALLPAAVAEHLSSVRHLIVAPILGLGTVPFAILRPFGSSLFLIDKMSVSIVPSLFDIEADTPAWKAQYKNPLIVGNPYFPKDAKWRVPPLPGAEEEAVAIGRMINARPLTGRLATKRRVMARAKQSDFLFIATHGIASSDDPLTGGFLFLTARNLTRGFWTAKEIQNSRLTAQLAVLSACQTGLGKVHDAGIIGLSRAFQIAGVPRVVMSLWSVYDKATAELMKAFVRYLRSNMPAEALRLAMLDVRRERPQLAQWASFVLFGTPR
jgi:hypothetical protein